MIPKTEKALVLKKDIEVAVTSTEHTSITEWKQSAVEFIQGFEGVRLIAYFDGYSNGSNRWSIGHGTKSYRGETLTLEEADKRFINHLNPLYELVNKSCYNDNQKIAMVSYMYNTGGYQMNLRQYIKRCSIKDIRYIMNIRGHNKSLIKRRREELYLFNK